MSHLAPQRCQPLFSVIVPTYGRPALLGECLRALRRLDYPRDGFEVLVVDDGSSRPPTDVVLPFRGELDVTLLTQPHAGPATARNTGAARARGRYLVFTDDDCRPTPSWLRALEGCFAETPSCLIGGRVINALSNNMFSATTQAVIDHLAAHDHDGSDGTYFFNSGNMAVPADTFGSLGGFDGSFALPAAEDRELCDRWRHRGPMRYAPDAVVHHVHALTLRSFWHQHIRYGRGAAQFYAVRGRRASGVRRSQHLRFYIRLLRYPFSQASPGRALPLVSLLILSQIATALGFTYESVTRRSQT